MSPISLRQLTLADESAATAAHAELASDNFEFLFDWNSAAPWADYVQMMQDFSQGKNLPADRVKADLLMGFDATNNLVGRLSLRYELNDFLREYGGHIGYAIRPEFRSRGYATEMLRAGATILRAAGLEQVLVTCFADNTASAAVIKKAGGVFDGARELTGRTMHRYLIDTAQVRRTNPL